MRELAAVALVSLALFGCERSSKVESRGTDTPPPGVSPKAAMADVIANDVADRPLAAAPAGTWRLRNLRGELRDRLATNHPYLSAARAETRLKNIATNQKVAMIRLGFTPATDKWPWNVALLDVPAPDDAFLYCSGALIAPQWVLTAAHCDIDQQDLLLIGSNDLTEGTGTPAGVAFECEYPGYDPDTLTSDIALVKLSSPVGASATSLPFDAVGSTAATIGSVIGWGATAPGETYSNTLQQADLPLPTEPACRGSLGAKLLWDSMLCAGSLDDDKGACGGDSGGPLIVATQAGNGWVQVGVASEGNHCIGQRDYGVYTRVSKFATWIQSTLAAAHPECRNQAP